MKTLIGSETEKNLMKAFAGESMAINRYSYFAKIAKKEGYEQISAIFLETAEQEKSHAKTFYKFLTGQPVQILSEYPADVIGSTVDNLKAAISAESEEWNKLYPKFAEIALKEGFKSVAIKFKLISTIEKFHQEKFKRLLDNIKSDRVFSREVSTKWLCRKCGYVYEGEHALKTCPACEHPQAYFEILVENY